MQEIYGKDIVADVGRIAPSYCACALHDALQERGVRCWLDEKQMLPGDDIYEQVDRGIRLWDKVLLCGCPRFAPVPWALTWAEGGTR